MKYPQLSFRAYPALLLTLAIAFAACKKDDDAPAPSSGGGGGGGSTQPNTTPTFTDADAVLAAVRVFSVQNTPIGDVTVTLGMASAVFSNDQLSSFENVGAVTCNGEALTRLGNNSYAYQPSAMSPTGIDLTSSNEVTWTVDGGAGFASMDETIGGPFPAVAEINSGATVVRNDGYTLSTTSVLNADSVIFVVGNVMRTLPGNVTSCTFTPADLSGLASGAAQAQVLGYRSTSQTIAGKKHYFVKQTSRSRSITIQ